MKRDIEKVKCIRYDGTMKTASRIAKEIRGICTEIPTARVIMDKDKNLRFTIVQRSEYMEWNNFVGVEYLVKPNEYVYQFDNWYPIVNESLLSIYFDMKEDFYHTGITSDSGETITGLYTPNYLGEEGHFIVNKIEIERVNEESITDYIVEGKHE